MHLPSFSQRHLFLIGLAVYALTAWRSEGYHHPDEHFQILEFANFRLGRTPAADLPWEFAAQIRPGLQPLVAYGAIRLAEAAGIDSPFVQIFLLRLLSGWLCLWLYFQWAKRLEADTSDPSVGHWLRLAVVFLWFVPYLSVRFSSENWAGLAFGGGLLLLLYVSPPNGGGVGGGVAATRLQRIAAGFLLGLSFFLRFQMGFALLGLGAWLVWQFWSQKRLGQMLAPMAWLVTGGLAALALGIWADAWLYGKPVCTACNYFTANILENKAANWGTSPWWYYPVQSLLTAVPPVSLVLLTLLFLGLWRARTSALAWSFVLFLLAHTAVGHKEMRFLYPMLAPILVLAVQGLAAWARSADGTVWSNTNRLVRAVWVVALVVNFLLLPVRSLLAAQESVPYFRFLYGYAAVQPKPLVVFSKEKSLYNVVGLDMHFYRAGYVQNRVVDTFVADTLLVAPAPSRLLLAPKLTMQDTLPGLHTERIYTYFPDWILYFNPNDWQSRSRIWSVHRY